MNWLRRACLCFGLLTCPHLADALQLELPSVARQTAERASAFDSYAMPADTKLEQRPRHPPSVGVWRRQVENQSRTFECVYGVEHGPERREALSALMKAHEEDDCAFPAEHIYSLWEELCAAWCEQLRERRRELTRQLNTDMYSW